MYHRGLPFRYSSDSGITTAQELALVPKPTNIATPGPSNISKARGRPPVINLAASRHLIPAQAGSANPP
ncbi:hypothetical protein O9929_12625 [Vibrio lentus]|nr:hypothetical protein [Vibrio lentus]